MNSMQKDSWMHPKPPEVVRYHRTIVLPPTKQLFTQLFSVIIHPKLDAITWVTTHEKGLFHIFWDLILAWPYYLWKFLKTEWRKCEFIHSREQYRLSDRNHIRMVSVFSFSTSRLLRGCLNTLVLSMVLTSLIVKMINNWSRGVQDFAYRFPFDRQKAKRKSTLSQSNILRVICRSKAYQWHVDTSLSQTL